MSKSACLILLLAVLMLSACNQAPAENPDDAVVRSNVHCVEVNLVTWARQNGGLYPASLTSDLLRDEHNDVLYNPYWFEVQAHPVAFTAGKARNGHISYIPVYDGYEIKDYILLGFGNDSNAGEDVDGDGKPDNVIQVSTSSGIEPGEIAAIISEMK